MLFRIVFAKTRMLKTPVERKADLRHPLVGWIGADFTLSASRK